MTAAAALRVKVPSHLSLFEKIHQGYLEDRITFWHPDVFVVLAIKQATRGHSLVIPARHSPDVDHVPTADARKLDIVNRATGHWLAAAFPGADYIAQAAAGKEVSHAHIHRAPCKDRDWFNVMGAPNPQPFVEMEANDWDEVYGRARFPRAYTGLVWQILAGSDKLAPAALDERLGELETMARTLGQELEPSTTYAQSIGRKSVSGP